MSFWPETDHVVDAMAYGAQKYGARLMDATSRRLERILLTRGAVDDGTRERLRTLINWEVADRVHLFGLDYRHTETMSEETKKLLAFNTAGCWLPGEPLVIFQEHKYVFPSERIFAEIALALAAGVGQNG